MSFLHKTVRNFPCDETTCHITTYFSDDETAPPETHAHVATFRMGDQYYIGVGIRDHTFAREIKLFTVEQMAQKLGNEIGQAPWDKTRNLMGPFTADEADRMHDTLRRWAEIKYQKFKMREYGDGLTQTWSAATREGKSFPTILSTLLKLDYPSAL